MANSNIQPNANSKVLPLIFLTASIPINGMAAESVSIASQASFDIWSTVIAVVVCSVAASVAYLCYGAARLWVGLWRILAITPLALLALWFSSLVAVTLASSATRTLWSFELLFWAMATTVYLVILFTARRTFEKAAAEKKGL